MAAHGIGPRGPYRRQRSSPARPNGPAFVASGPRMRSARTCRRGS